MYWLIGSFIIIAMMGVLAVADSMALPISPWLMHIVNTPILSLSLAFLVIILLVISQFNIPFVNTTNPSRHSSRYSQLAARIANHILVAILAIGLVIGSALQALVSHQQAEATKIIEPMRVQALVSIEGISDSVYDATPDTGYRQVATINYVTPLVSELTAQDLDTVSANYRAGLNNSLSIDKVNNDYLSENDLSRNSTENIEYRVLLNAYPKKPVKQPLNKASNKPSNKPSKRSSNKTTKQNQMIDLNHLQPGDKLFMTLTLTLTLTPLATSEQALNNPSGFDSYRWLRGRHIDGVANIMATSSSTVALNDSASLVISDDSYLQRLRTSIDQGRWQLRQHFYQGWSANTAAQQQAKAVTLSLLTGDRSLISRDTKDLYQLAGISHLLAISGTHVLFLAIMFAGAIVLLLNRLYPAVYRYVSRWQVRWWVMISAAFIYALFTGFDVPAARTAWMLLAVGVARLTLLPISTMRVLFALAVLMAWRDPYVLWQAGYWLSFIAVVLLLKYDDTSQQRQQLQSSQSPIFTHNFSPNSRPPNNSSPNNLYKNRHVLTHIWLGFKRLFKLQCWLFIALLPVTLLLFGKASLWGLVINLFAIGLFGWIIVPLNLLAGLCYLILPPVAEGIWTLVIAMVSSLHELIAWLTALPALSDAWLYTPVNLAILLMVILAMLPWLVPRGLISRWLAIPPLSLLVMTVYANQQSLTMTPSLYVLPTGDQYISASLLQYPVINNTDKKNVSWLFLADHRPMDARTMASSLTADKLSAALEQQLGSLSVNKLEGIVVQSSSIGVTDSRAYDNTRNAINPKASELLPMTVAQLSQRLPVSQYWQAGRSERWSALQEAYKVANHSQSAINISAQRCEAGKTWQLANGGLTLQATTGWSNIEDASVWDCTVAIDSSKPIRVLKYHASDPLKSLPVTVQTLTSDSQQPTDQAHASQSRLILNTDTHQRVWQMWSLMCSAETKNTNVAMNRTTWLGHSASHISADVISRQQIREIITYDDKPLEAALSVNAIVDTDTYIKP
ncbi:ComEC/Rec2 family competence protein [Psychrobacter sp. DAB_AL32B]|uniref:ComEC/Rec2 family competence protein n=1 Tax=Psychrobacter sp. DAB_AL32B TaxID=1028414 RepID=UPI0020C3C89A|nr:ComEC/Rec2 family competence protein [Psychrobacter sp. DAB_AL32B]